MSTNREYLEAKTSAEIGDWLDEERVAPTPAPARKKADWSKFPNFRPSEFVCPCGKCEMSDPKYAEEHVPEEILFIAQTTRNYYGKPLNISSGGRCQAYNDSLKGSVKNSPHCTFSAIDFGITGVTNTVSGRNDVCAFMKKLPYYKYSYHNSNGKYPNMGSCIHVNT